MITQMELLRIILLKQDLQVVVKALYETGGLHIEDIENFPALPVQKLLVAGELLNIQEENAYLLARIEGILETLGQKNQPPKNGASAPTSMAEIRQQLEELLPQIQQLSEEREHLQAELDILPRYIRSLEKLLPIVPQSANDPGKISIGILIDKEHIETLEVIKNQFLEISGDKAEFVTGDMDAQTKSMLVVCPREYLEQIETLMNREELSRFRLPTGYDNLSPESALTALKKQLEKIPLEITQIKNEINILGEKWTSALLNWKAGLQENADQFEVWKKFGQTDYTVVILGWIPSHKTNKFIQTLQQNCSTEIFIENLPISPENKKLVPVSIHNPQPARSFEGLVKLYSQPQYDGIDPSGLVSVFLPLFFGMILGDIGYGLALILLSQLLKRRFKSGMLHDLLNIVSLGSLWAVGFGFLFGEFFGDLGERLGLHPIWMDRAKAENLFSLLLITIGIGFTHILLGLVLGIWRSLAEKNRHLLLERGGMLLGLVGLFLLVASLTSYLPPAFKTPSIALLITGIVLLGYSMGKTGFLIGPIEFLGVIGNVLSYMRIAAIGLASVYLAKVANEIAGMIGSLVVGIIVATLIHSLNLVMGAFSPSIHSLRLHYVEFFRKFYTGGGKAYRPFQKLSS